MIRKILIIGMLVLPLFSAFGKNKPKGQGGTWNFEKWEWVPIPPSLAKSLRPLKLKGIDLNIDYWGPAYRRWNRHGVAGHMVEGEEAYKGKSVFVNNLDLENKVTVQMGLHGVFSGILKPGTTYSYKVALKGQGTFILRAWVQGVEPVTGNTTWLGFPDLIKVSLTDTWTVATGTLKIPDFKNKDYQPKEYIGCAILVEPGSAVYFDELNIVPKKSNTSMN